MSNLPGGWDGVTGDLQQEPFRAVCEVCGNEIWDEYDAVWVGTGYVHETCDEISGNEDELYV